VFAKTHTYYIIQQPGNTTPLPASICFRLGEGNEDLNGKWADVTFVRGSPKRVKMFGTDLICSKSTSKTHPHTHPHTHTHTYYTHTHTYYTHTHTYKHPSVHTSDTSHSHTHHTSHTHTLQPFEHVDDSTLTGHVDLQRKVSRHRVSDDGFVTLIVDHGMPVMCLGRER